jgi:hypothetical protein
MQIATARFADLLRRSEEWDKKFPALCHPQREYLLTEFVYGDVYCVWASRWNRYAWDIPRLAGNKLYTRCG